MKKILLDTDIGTDVDDAVCLAYLLAQPECDLLGITTVTGEAEKRASLASVLCLQAGRDIPIFPGANAPMKGKQRQPVCQQAKVLPRWRYKRDFPAGQALDFMAETVRSNPGEVTLLTIGPLTNVGMLFSKYPDVPNLLAGMVMMGGLFGTEAAASDQVEWNIAGDPLAAEVVYKAPLKFHRSVGLNVTQKVVLGENEVRQRFTALLLKPVLDMAEVWFRQFYPCITFHDPLAAATIFAEDLCAYEYGTVTVDTVEMPGRLGWSSGGPASPHQAAVEVDVKAYFNHFFGCFG